MKFKLFSKYITIYVDNPHISSIIINMKPKQQRIAIAKICGLKNIRQENHWRMGDHLVHGNGTIVPNYLNDLNAMHEAEKDIFSLQHSWDKYLDNLYDLCGADNMVHATATQRAKAFLQTLGKWIEN